MTGFEDCKKNDASEWLECDENHHGYQIVNDEVITNTS